MTSQKILRTPCIGVSDNDRVFIADSAKPSSHDGPKLTDEAHPFIELTYPGYMDDEIELSFYNYNPDNDGDGCDQVAQVCLNKDELDSLIHDLHHLRNLMT